MAADSFRKESETPEFTTIAELASNLVYRLPLCEDMFVRRALQDAYVEFCRLANALVTEREIPLEIGETDYPVQSIVPDCRIENVRSVRIGSRRVLREGIDYGVSSGIPPVITVRGGILPERNGDGCTLSVQCLEMPNSGSERAPRWFIRKYGDAVCAGALVKLFSMTGRSWSDPSQARMELGKWEGYVTAARIGSMSGSPFGNGRLDTVDTSDLL